MSFRIKKLIVMAWVALAVILGVVAGHAVFQGDVSAVVPTQAPIADTDPDPQVTVLNDCALYEEMEAAIDGKLDVINVLLVYGEDGSVAHHLLVNVVQEISNEEGLAFYTLFFEYLDSLDDGANSPYLFVWAQERLQPTLTLVRAYKLEELDPVYDLPTGYRVQPATVDLRPEWAVCYGTDQ